VPLHDTPINNTVFELREARRNAARPVEGGEFPRSSDLGYCAAVIHYKSEAELMQIERNSERHCRSWLLLCTKPLGVKLTTDKK
jgi:hypothetical protein